MVSGTSAAVQQAVKQSGRRLGGCRGIQKVQPCASGGGMKSLRGLAVRPLRPDQPSGRSQGEGAQRRGGQHSRNFKPQVVSQFNSGQPTTARTG
jgi:hypothetical protein